MIPWQEPFYQEWRIPLQQWESVAFTAWMNSDFPPKYQRSGRAIVVYRGARLEAQLELIPDDINRLWAGESAQEHLTTECHGCINIHCDA